ncbi:MAG: hypothetical protein JXQ73_03380 [Phycisphaerae bacterium]|nr:hypothetical protein [Phycisphaerae bacterium]
MAQLDPDSSVSQTDDEGALRAQSPSPAPADDDVEIHCPNCKYNLTGLTKGRCPECGQAFNRAELIEWMAAPDQPLPYGQRSGTQTRFALLFRDSLLDPCKLARGLPGRPDAGDGRLHGHTCRAIASLIVVVAFTILTDGDGFGYACLAGALMLLASHAVEVIIAALLNCYTIPCNIPEDNRYAFWRTLCNCFASYYLLLVAFPICLPLFLNLVALGLDVVALLVTPWLLTLSPLLPLGWWWYCLSRAIAARTFPSTGRTLVTLSIPFLVAGSFLISLFIVVVAAVLTMEPYPPS